MQCIFLALITLSTYLLILPQSRIKQSRQYMARPRYANIPGLKIRGFLHISYKLLNLLHILGSQAIK